MSKNWFCECDVRGGGACVGCPCAYPMTELDIDKKLDRKYVPALKTGFSTIFPVSKKKKI